MNTEDGKLLLEIAKGNSKSFELLFKKYKNKVFGLCKKLLREQAASEELAQEVWFQVIKSASQYKEQGESALPWIMIMTRNRCLNHLKKNSKWTELSPEDEQNIPDQQSDMSDLIESEDKIIKLKSCLDTLPEKQRVAVNILITEDLSQAEIAKLMSLSVANIKVILFRARENLLSCMRGLL